MLNKSSFKKPDLWLESHNKHKLIGKKQHEDPSIPEEMWRSCPECKKAFLASAIINNDQVCPGCSYHMRMTARERLDLILDDNSFIEFDQDMTSTNKIAFPDYDKKLESAKKATNEREAVVCGTGRIDGLSTVICVMEPGFIMGSMGCVVGEKITRAFEYATAKRLPVIVFSVSGGARMQEGILSLMQMAKTSGAVKLHSDAGLLYVSVLTNPTTGGVTA
ncbi:MAG: acetyl-CoA carboxylase carboxyltransferase subunit beta, partial [Saccharofermentanales bacterium]